MNEIKVRLRIFLILFFLVMVLGAVGFMRIEDASLIDSIYFIVVTMATVGYGDVHPFTPLGKVFALLIIVMGVGIFLGVVANATELMLSRRERESKLEKLNMVIGVFFSEVGTSLLRMFSHYDPNFSRIRKELIITDRWTQSDFLAVNRHLREYSYEVSIRKVDFEGLRNALLEKRAFMLRLLENPVLLEHEAFTDLLRGVFHLTEELACRSAVREIPETDKVHLGGDIKRAYLLLLDQWLKYMLYLKTNYPYLYSLAMRTNPFDLKASPIVKE